jgi:hypothetical protein
VVAEALAPRLGPVPGADPSAVEPRMRTALRRELSPLAALPEHHVLDRFMVVDLDEAISRDARQNPDALTPFLAMAHVIGPS